MHKKYLFWHVPTQNLSKDYIDDIYGGYKYENASPRCCISNTVAIKFVKAAY